MHLATTNSTPLYSTEPTEPNSTESRVLVGSVEWRCVENGEFFFLHGHHLMAGWWCNFLWVTFSTTIQIARSIWI